MRDNHGWSDVFVKKITVNEIKQDAKDRGFTVQRHMMLNGQQAYKISESHYFKIRTLSEMTEEFINQCLFTFEK